ncbi:MAG TPA: alkaline phosphatase family protein [Candidatus Tumulicola sp.]|jgi:phospholipase C
MNSRGPLLGATLSVALLTSACGGGGGGASPISIPPLPPAKDGKYFKHIVIMIQENRTFDNLFATFPGADGTTVGKTHDGGTLPLLKEPLVPNPDLSPSNGYQGDWIVAYNGGRMNAFDLLRVEGHPGSYLYRYVDPAQIQPYWTLAKSYVLADHMFQTEGSGSYTAHQDLIAGGTMIDDTHALIDFPNVLPWGCDSPPGTTTKLIDAANHISKPGPFPCLKYQTLRDTLDAKGLTWRYYAPKVNGGDPGGQLWSAFDSIRAVRYGPEWGTNVVWPETTVFQDIDRDSLPDVSWVIPDFQNSDHPGGGSDTGPSWVAQVVNAIGKSPAWKDTAIVVVWDDWGGWYDHVSPPKPLTYGGLGSRVPMLVISPFAKKGYVMHAQYEFGSIIKLVEENWDLPSLGTTDVRAASFLNDAFDFGQIPRAFATVKARYSLEYFLHQKPSGKPVDTE